MKKSMVVFSLLIAGLLPAEVFVKEPFDGFVGGVPSHVFLQRAEQVTVVNGSGPIGDDPALRFVDESTSRPGILEYNPGQAPAGAYYISFDLLNNNPAGDGVQEPILFCVGPWGRGRGVALGANASRAFALEFMDSGNTRTVAIRIGKSAAQRDGYNMAELQKVKIMVNDHDTLPLPYVRPDTKEQALLNPDSVVIFINNKLVNRESASGVSMQTSVSQGNAVLGRFGFGSSTSSTVDFLVDNLHVMSIPAPMSSVPEAAAESAPSAPPLVSKSPGFDGQGGTVYLHETFDSHTIGSAPKCPQLNRVDQVTVVDGTSKLGSGPAARFDDDDAARGGALEYNVGTAELGSLYVEFDAVNNAPTKGDKSAAVYFGVAQWGVGKSLMLNAKAKRAFGLEMYQQSGYLKLRVGDSSAAYMHYDPSAPFNVKVWVNDHDSNTLSYNRPDTGVTVLLNPDSVVVWINNSLLGKLQPAGFPMNKKVTDGDAVLGRVGFSSTSKTIADFLIDNLHIEDPSGESKLAALGTVVPSVTGEVTPVRMAGAETVAYREGENAMNLFVYKPEGWAAGGKRSALLYFFGGGWTKGTPLKSGSTAAWAASQGMVGIAPDYRTKNRFDTSPLASVADSRAALNWVVEHAEELGIDPNRIAVGGGSAGGHVALWTAIEKTPPGSDPAESPKVKPAAIFLSSAVTDTSSETGYTPKRFGDDAVALSPVDQLDAKMPPIVMFHAVDDSLVNYSTAVALHDKLKATGNECEFITVPRGGHGFSSEFPEWKPKVRAKMEELFKKTGLLPAVR